MKEKQILKDNHGRFLPGGVPNPNGRPKKEASLTMLIQEMLDQQADYIGVGAVPTDKTWRQLVVKALFTKAVKGDIKAIDLILERCDGKVTQPVSSDGEIVLRVKYDT